MNRLVLLFVLFLACVSLAWAKKHSKHGGGSGGRSHANHTGVASRHAAARSRRQHNKIVGGEPAAKGEFPYQVAVEVSESDGDYMCGGSIIDSQYILTAAHCVYGHVSQVTVRVGSLDFDSGTEHRVSEYTVHPEYDPVSTDHDVAILKLSHKIKLNGKTVKAVELATEEPAEGTDITIAGWGVTEEDGDEAETLMKVTVPVVSREACNDAYGGITEFMICAGYTEGGKDTCQGDSGGPAVNPEHVQVGIVSFGSGCARPGVPGVYSNVAALRDFIKEIAGV